MQKTGRFYITAECGVVLSDASSRDEAVALLQMTPFAWRAKPESGKHWQQKKCSTARRTLIFTLAAFLLTVEVRPEDLDADAVSTSPPRISAFFPIIEPIKRQPSSLMLT